MRKRKSILPAGLSTKQKRSLAGQRGAAKSHWRHGFNSPLSPKDTGWAERMATDRKLILEKK